MTKTDWEQDFYLKFTPNSIYPVEVMDFIKEVVIPQELKREREEMGRVLRMKGINKRGCKSFIFFRDGYNDAVKKLNQAIDNYLKEREK